MAKWQSVETRHQSLSDSAAGQQPLPWQPSPFLPVSGQDVRSEQDETLGLKPLCPPSCIFAQTSGLSPCVLGFWLGALVSWCKWNPAELSNLSGWDWWFAEPWPVSFLRKPTAGGWGPAFSGLVTQRPGMLSVWPGKPPFSCSCCSDPTTDLNCLKCRLKTGPTCPCPVRHYRLDQLSTPRLWLWLCFSAIMAGSWFCLPQCLYVHKPWKIHPESQLSLPKLCKHLRKWCNRLVGKWLVNIYQRICPPWIGSEITSKRVGKVSLY